MTVTSQPQIQPQDRPGPARHRTIDRVTQILETVVAQPGLSFSDLVRSLGAAKSSVHGFVQGLLANGWLHEERGRFYLGPALYGLTIASGQFRAGTVTYDDLQALHRDTGLSAYLGTRAGDYLIYVAGAGNDPVGDFHARSDIRRELLQTSGGKVLLAAASEANRAAFLRRRPESERELVFEFLRELPEIQRGGVVFNHTRNRTRLALATVVRNRMGEAVASLTLVGPDEVVDPRRQELAGVLLAAVARLEARQV